jgi:Tol biopolymer transport system component
VHRAVVLVAVAGCGFQTGAGAGGSPVDDAAVDSEADASSDADPDAPPDAPIDAPPVPTCLERWGDNTIRFGMPVVLANVNSTSFERDPFLTADELTLYLSTARVGSMGGDTWVATRANIAMPFGTPVRANSFSTAGNETKTSITANGLFAVVGSDQAGGAGGVDIWETSRATTGVAWGPLVRTHVMMVETAGSDHDPMISANGLRLYAAPDNPGGQHVVVASRATLTANFGAPATIINSGSGDVDPSVTPDEKIMLFYSARATTFAGGNIWYATRSDATAAFGTQRIVPDVNSDFNDGDPHLSSDGCRLYFGRDGGIAGWELFMAAAQ